MEVECWFRDLVEAWALLRMWGGANRVEALE
jgi:hypothetical protein